MQARTWNEPFMHEMEVFVKFIVEMVRPYLASYGGNIIMMQIENEYGNVEKSYGDDGIMYINWAAKLANR